MWDALLCFIHISLGFANLLKTHFPTYECKVLRYISELFLQKRVKRINFIAKEKKIEKKVENAAKKAEKEEKKAEKAAKKGTKGANDEKNVHHSYSTRSAYKIAQYRND